MNMSQISRDSIIEADVIVERESAMGSWNTESTERAKEDQGEDADVTRMRGVG